MRASYQSFEALRSRVAGLRVAGLRVAGLRLMGIDHERLTYRWGGRDYRLTDVHGRVVQECVL